ncbi:Putative ribonuclease H-like superfamily, exonuclease, RNase T/DNA polymerase III [Colletotrichum destructivum]|uniref:Ribonuclease H-like superfamily, exonuclease, RNase T/DNA polymerase III n=1 Tax=Colletotrichum destructivum TaxID=34406 RepID=A0AAX4IL03_9PEZI|nr:Putative ribonuclease H-like superfamily, exonuclease, RNase T/DNA polymerase III [Colletotrichum destructivum]
MNQHSLDKHHVHQAIQAVARPAPAEPPSSARTRVDPLNYRGITYSRISDVGRDDLLRRLAGLCHSEQRLVKEGHRMPPTTYLPCPDTDSSKPKFAAIVLDCEMAGTVEGQNELIHLTLVDFVSGDVLQNCLVNPSKPIRNWREDITGISAAGMQQAVAKNEALHGWKAARDELWRFADEETILIGQSIHHDLKALHTYHSRIVDSAIITADAVLRSGSRIRKRWGLETLCRELLGIQIRQSSQTGDGLAHDALEDALAARELIVLCTLKPERLEIWACAARKAFFEKSDSKSKKLRAGSNQRKRVSQQKAREQEDIDEMLTWEDVVDYEIWPKSPPDSD